MQTYTAAGLPLSGTTSQSRHASYLGATTAEPRALPQVIRYLQLLHEVYPDGLTDAESAIRLTIDPAHPIERSSVNARRGPLVTAGLVEPYGFRERVSSQLPNTIWRLRLPARALSEAA